MTFRIHRALRASALVAAVAACSDSTNGGGGTPPGDLSYIRLAPTAPALCSDTVSAYFKKGGGGSSQEIALTFPENGDTANCGTTQTEDFLRLRLTASSLFKLPNGTLINDGDSVLISVRWVGSDSILFDLQPSGLQFSSGDPARLRIEYGEAGDDLNEDGTHDGQDSVVEHQLTLWRQENPGDPFVRLQGTVKSEDDNEIEATLNGFSRYALAY